MDMVSGCTGPGSVFPGVPGNTSMGGAHLRPPRHRSPKSWAAPKKVLCQLLPHKPQFYCAIHLRRLVANFAESTGMTWVQRKSPGGDAKTPQNADPCLKVLSPSAQRPSRNKKRGRPLSPPQTDALKAPLPSLQFSLTGGPCRVSNVPN